MEFYLFESFFIMHNQQKKRNFVLIMTDHCRPIAKEKASVPEDFLRFRFNKLHKFSQQQYIHFYYQKNALKKVLNFLAHGAMDTLISPLLRISGDIFVPIKGKATKYHLKFLTLHFLIQLEIN